MTAPASERTPDERRRRAQIGERWTALCFAVSVLGALGLAVVFWRGGQPQLEGLFLAMATGGFGVGLVIWAKYFMPHRPVVEERKELASTEEERAEFRAELERGEHILERRGLLLKMGGAALAALAAALVFPIRSLGPRPGRGFKSTPFGRGVRLVDEANRPIRAADIPVDGLVTAFPEGGTSGSAAASAATVVIRPRDPVQPREGREDWTPDGIVAYSKICTHVGCPVGLYQTEEHLLLCPCHQSTFDVLDSARPVFGPAARSLPQLPLAIDGDGNLVATGDFPEPTGPGFWDRGR